MLCKSAVQWIRMHRFYRTLELELLKSGRTLRMSSLPLLTKLHLPINLGAPPRRDATGDNVTVTGMDLLDARNTTASSDSVVGTHIPAPSPRRSTPSPATHQLQQTLRNDASEQVRRCDSSSPARSNDGRDEASAFSAFDANDPPTIVETVQEGNSDDGDGWPEGEWPEGEGLAGNLATADDNDAQVNLIPRSSGACDKIGTACDSGLQSLAINTAENLVIDANDPDREDFVISVRALGNASGTPLDGMQNKSFREDVAEERHIVDSAAKLGASRNSGGWFNRSGMKVHSRSESSASCDTSPSFNPRDPKVLADLLTRPPEPSARSPTSTMQFNEQTVVTECTCGGAASTTIGNLGGADNARPSSSLPGGDALRQHANAGGNSNGGNSNSNGSPNSGNSGGSDSNGNQGGTSGGNDPQDSGPNVNDLNKILLEYTTVGGALQHWGIQGTIRAEELVQLSGFRDPQTYQRVLQSKRHLMRPEIVDRVTGNTHFLYQYNEFARVQTIIDGMLLFVHTTPGTRMTSKNATMLEDHVASTQQMCCILGRHLAFADTLSPDQLPLRVPLLLYGERMHTHPHVIVGSFDYVKKVDEANAVVIPYGVDERGAQIVDPPVIILPAPTSNTPGTRTSPNSDPNAALLQGVLAAMRTMTQVHVQSDQRNACMSQQQARLQAATLQSNAQQLEHLTNHLGNLGYKVGRAISTHPTRHSHALQATLSPSNTVAGQSTDP